MFTAVPGDDAKRVTTGRFSDVRRVDETGSTNADLLALARDGAPEGIVLVADHQTAGRPHRTVMGWRHQELRCCSVLARPPGAPPA